MKIFQRKLSFVCALALTICVAHAQAPFYNEIQQFKKQDSVLFPPKNAIVFAGSSSFRKWTDVQSYFPDYTIINRGFGGSTLPDVILYAHDIIIAYHPSQVLIYAGDNDLASSDAVTADSVLNRFKRLFYIIRKALPNTNISFVSIKPSPSREKLMPKMEAANTMVQSFLAKQPNTAFIDVYHPMLVNNKPMPDIFLEDNLHMNKKGYDIWQKVIQPYLKK